jgi:hypothetical protein
LLQRLIHAQEKERAARDTNRLVRPFEWGTSFIDEHAATTNGDDDPRRIFREHTEKILRHSDDFYALPPIHDYRLKDDELTWTSAVETPSRENNTARARFFPVPAAADKSNRAPKRPGRRGGRRSPEDAGNVERDGVAELQDARARDGRERRRAVVVLPQWNADSEGHVALCRILNRLGIAALRVTLPYHEARRPPELERADYLVSPNIGRTIQSMRQAVLDTRAAVRWLREQGGFERVGIAGTSIGSCTAFLAFAHDPTIDVGVFNHVSGYVADVVWRGISTQHVREGLADQISLEELRQHWLPISPVPFAQRLLQMPSRPMRFIAARYDLTFPRDLSRDVIEVVRRLGVPVDVAWLPCGHYTSGERPWVYLDGWKIVNYFRKHL